MMKEMDDAMEEMESGGFEEWKRLGPLVISPFTCLLNSDTFTSIIFYISGNNTWTSRI